MSKLPKRLIELENLKPRISHAGANLLCIAAEKRGGMWEPEKFLRLNPFSFPCLLDEDRNVIKAYGLFHRVGMDAWNIRAPSYAGRGL